PFVKLVGLTDTANGIAPIAEPGTDNVFFANVDLTIHFLREPVGEWLGFATSANIGQTGGGITSAILYDTDGILGRCEQAQDRKSTRLNSSHVSISYAVFCLKKKKNSIQGSTKCDDR